MIRGLTAVVMICPKNPSFTLVSGLLNCGWLNALKNSVRNSSVASSRRPPTLVVLARDISQLYCPGPSTSPKPPSPNPNAPGSSEKTPSEDAGGAAVGAPEGTQ